MHGIRRSTLYGSPAAPGPAFSVVHARPDPRSTKALKRILVTGAAGQIGSELVPALVSRYGEGSVLATDLRLPSVPGDSGAEWLRLDCTSEPDFRKVVREFRPDAVYHLAAVLSAVGEQDPLRTWRINTDGLLLALELAREGGFSLFTPSSIAAFGPDSPRDPAPQDAIQRPTSMYGVTKVAGELLCDYYHLRFGVDARGVRFPGIVSHRTPPGGGTTDWAVEIYHAAVREGRYECFLGPETQLDMMYMPDAVRCAIEVMEVDPGRLRHRNAFNVTAMQLTPERVAASIRTHLPDFRIEYAVDPVRQRIADSWPSRIDDSAARDEWGWLPRFDLAGMTADMLDHLSRRS